MKKMSVIIVAYENGDVLKRNLNLIHKYNDLNDDLQVIVVDNSPDDRKVKKFVEEADCDCLYIANENKGYGAANNTGADLAEGKILGFINPDVYLIEPIFQKICDYFDKNINTATLGCKLYYGNMKPSYSFTFEYEDSLLKKLKNRIRNLRDDYHEEDMFTSGSNLFIKKELFDKVGCFDENYFMYYEEADLKNRIRKYDPYLRFVYRKDLKLIHLGGSEAYSEFRFRNLNDSSIYYGKKWNLDYRKKIRYEYDSHKLKKVFYRFINRNRYENVSECVSAYERYYSEFLK